MAHANADTGADDAALLSVSVVYSPRAGEVDEVALRLAPGATVGDAVRASGLQARHPQAALDVLPVGIWGSFCQYAQFDKLGRNEWPFDVLAVFAWSGSLRVPATSQHPGQTRLASSDRT